MSKQQTFLLAGIALALFSSAVQADIDSLRGDVPLDEASIPATIQRVQADHSPDARAFVQQPPLIPHRIDGYTINLKFNKCLTCHSWANYRNKGATKISPTHFNDRDGGVLASVSGLRYFCVQCHVPQVDAKPLVENTFEPLRAIQQN